MNPYFSVLVPVCNQVGKMDECVASLKGQTFGDFEVICVDDGSKDDSVSMLEGFAKEDARFHVYCHGENKSLLAARYTGMEHASGRYILFLDSDDYWEKNTLELLHEKLEKEPLDVVRFGYQMDPAGEQFLPPESDDPVRDYLLDKFPPAIWKNCYSADVIKLVLERSESFYCNMGEDACLCGILFSCAKSFGTLNEVLYHYVMGTGMSNTRKNLTIEKLKRDLTSLEAGGEHLLAFMEKYNPDYLEATKITANRMLKFVVFQHVYFEEDWDKVFEFLGFFNQEKYQNLFDYGCNTVIPLKVRKKLGLEVDKKAIFA